MRHIIGKKNQTYYVCTYIQGFCKNIGLKVNQAIKAYMQS